MLSTSCGARLGRVGSLSSMPPMMKNTTARWRSKNSSTSVGRDDSLDSIPKLHGVARVAASPRIRRSTLLPLVLPVLLLVIAAYVQWFTAGLPPLPIPREITQATATEPYGFPLWIGITHYVNL